MTLFLPVFPLLLVSLSLFMGSQDSRGQENTSNTPTPVPNVSVLPSADRSNRITLLAGYGPDGLTVNGNEIKPFRAPIGGVGYSRRVWEDFSVTVQVMGGYSFATSGIGMAGVGYDF
jgi:hypothetical protein